MGKTVRWVVTVVVAAALSGRAMEASNRPSTSSSRQALGRGRAGMVVISVALAAFSVLFVLVRTKRSAATDAAITLRVQTYRHPFLARTMDVISWPGFPPQSRLIPPSLAGLLWLAGFRLEAVFQGLAWGTSGISFFFKSIVRRPRPQGEPFRVAVANIGGTSFPSGHVLNYMGVYGFLAYLVLTLVRPAALRRLILAGLMTMLSLVGLSRVYLGHHWFTDVLASYLLGISYLIGITAVYRRMKAWFQ